ncbi:MAG: BlaI/MecI/CopY family transcriptional regulator [Limisphaerales bacterium]
MTVKKTMAKRSSPRARRLPQISDAEWVVMKVVWNQAPITANQVVAALERRTDWKPKTIQTLLRRLVLKGALAFEKQGREYLFEPRVDAVACVRAASRSFLRRFFDGEVAPFLACFLEQEKLTPKEVQELKEILDGKKR